MKRFLPILLVVAVTLAVAIFISMRSGSETAIKFIFADKDPLKSTDGKVNILLLGNAGGTHDGSTLTDTIMVASINRQENKVYLVSLPRDFWVEGEQAKINAVYEYAKDDPQGPLNHTKEVMGDILGIPVHYAIRVDFNGFIKAVDELGGIDVPVEKSFDDYNYPIEEKRDDLCGWEEKEIEFDLEEAQKYNIEPGKRLVLLDPTGKIATDSAEPDKGIEYFRCRYERISFKAGLTRMDGETALKFVRSRLGTNGEGSDFARSKRQQIVLESLRDKLLSVETLTSPTKIGAILKTFGYTIETDITPKEAFEFYKLSKKIDKTDSFVIDSSGKESLLANPPLQDYGGAWVLVPRAGNYDEIHNFVAQVLSGEGVKDEATSAARTR